MSRDILLDPVTGDLPIGSMGKLADTLTSPQLLAQRIEAHTGAYQVLISQTTYDEVKEHVAARALPALRVKGSSEAVPVYLVTGLAEEEAGDAEEATEAQPPAFEEWE